MAVSLGPNWPDFSAAEARDWEPVGALVDAILERCAVVGTGFMRTVGAMPAGPIFRSVEDEHAKEFSLFAGPWSGFIEGNVDALLSLVPHQTLNRGVLYVIAKAVARLEPMFFHFDTSANPSWRWDEAPASVGRQEAPLYYGASDLDSTRLGEYREWLAGTASRIEAMRYVSEVRRAGVWTYASELLEDETYREWTEFFNGAPVAAKALRVALSYDEHGRSVPSGGPTDFATVPARSAIRIERDPQDETFFFDYNAAFHYGADS